MVLLNRVVEETFSEKENYSKKKIKIERSWAEIEGKAWQK